VKKTVSFKLNGRSYALEVDAKDLLLDVIRENLGLTGTKRGCENGECGACTILIDGKAENSCLVLAITAEGKDILTIEGLSDGVTLHPLQQAFVDNAAVQCGFCAPGMLLSAKALLDGNPNPSEHEIREAIAGNLCRCSGYVKIVKAVRQAAAVLASTGVASAAPARNS